MKVEPLKPITNWANSLKCLSTYLYCVVCVCAWHTKIGWQIDSIDEKKLVDKIRKYS